jgi:hypothetical protein
LGAGLNSWDASGELDGDQREEREDGLRGAQPVDPDLVALLDDLVGGRGRTFASSSAAVASVWDMKHRLL